MLPTTEIIDLVGTLRACTPEETLARIRPLFGTFGLTRLARVTGLDKIGIHVTVAVRPMSRSLSVSQGKGMSPALADVSAAMESIELWHAEHLSVPDIEGSFSGLCARYEMIDPQMLPPDRYAGGVDLHEAPCGWYRGRELVTGGEALVPDYAVDMRADASRPEWATVMCSSNGLASGNTREEATCHALFEVIERDAVARLGERSDTAIEAEIDLATVQGPARSMLHQLERARIHVRVWDATSAAEVPTFFCSLRGENELRGLNWFSGQGTHLSKDIALLRALTEAVQSRLTLIAGSRDDISASHYAEMRRSAHEPLLSKGSPKRDYASVLSPQVPVTFSGMIEEITRSVQRLGAKQAVVIDLTKPGVGIPVVFAVVPGLMNDPH